MDKQKEKFINDINKTNKNNDNSKVKYMLIRYNNSIEYWEVVYKIDDYSNIIQQAATMAVSNYVYDILVLTDDNTYESIGIGKSNNDYICLELINIYTNIYLNSTYDNTSQDRVNIALLIVCEAINNITQSLDDVIQYVNNTINEINITYINDLNKVTSMPYNSITLKCIDSINNLYNKNITCLRELYDKLNQANNICGLIKRAE